jgi:copper chaperone CopZ
MKTHKTYTISGMTCNNCVARVKAALTPLADEVEVSLKPPQIRLTGLKESVESLNAALKNIGNYHIGAEILAVKNEVETKSFFVTYKPLLLVFFYILLVTLAIEFAHGGLFLSIFIF